jgi:hypothetical protein
LRAQTHLAPRSWAEHNELLGEHLIDHLELLAHQAVYKILSHSRISICSYRRRGPRSKLRPWGAEELPAALALTGIPPEGSALRTQIRVERVLVFLKIIPQFTGHLLAVRAVC